MVYLVPQAFLASVVYLASLVIQALVVQASQAGLAIQARQQLAQLTTIPIVHLI